MKTYPTAPIIKSPQRGFSLLEVLISLAVLSIGLLGLAALQTVGLRINHDSYQRTQATMLAYDIADRMRANSVGLAAGKYNAVLITTNPTGPDCIASTCTPAEVADYDIRTWHEILALKLSGGEGAISTTVSGVITTRTITIIWRENDLPMQLRVVVQL